MSRTRKRGFAGDLLYALVIIFVLGFFLAAGIYTLSSVKSGSDANFNLNAGNGFFGLVGMASVAPLAVVGLGGALIVSGVFIRAFPLLFIAFFLVNVMTAFVSMNLANSWFDAFSTGTMGAEVQANMPAWVLVFQYFPLISIILGTIFAIAMFAKGGGQQ